MIIRELSAKVQRVLAREKISREELQEMLNRAAITSIGDCNRRFHHWVFLTIASDSAVLDMKYAEPFGKGVVVATCPRCNGHGDTCCGWWGTVRKPRN